MRAAKKRDIQKIVAYCRVSLVKKNKKSDLTPDERKQMTLGLDAQVESVNRLAASYSAKIIGRYVEVETATGKRERPELAKAIAHARLSKATLVVAKIDRLSRNLLFVEKLRDSKVDFVACDMPEANTLMIQVMAIIAEQEARQISTRTREALQAAKANGTLLGSSRPGHWKGREKKRGFLQASKAGAIKRTQNAVQCYSFLIDTIRQMQKEGKFLWEIAAWLNDEGHLTTRGNPFVPSTVLRIVRLFDREAVSA